MDKMLTGVMAYDPSQVILSLGGWEPWGFAADTKIVINKTNDIINPYSGTDGDVSLALSRNRLGTLTMSLQRTCPANEVLAAYAQTMYSTRQVAFSVYLEDPRGYYISTIGWIQSQPDDTIGETIQENQWVIGLKDASLLRSTVGVGVNALNSISALTIQ